MAGSTEAAPWQCRGVVVKARPGESRTDALARFFQRVHELGLGNPLAHAQANRNPTDA